MYGDPGHMLSFSFAGGLLVALLVLIVAVALPLKVGAHFADAKRNGLFWCALTAFVGLMAGSPGVGVVWRRNRRPARCNHWLRDRNPLHAGYKPGRGHRTHDHCPMCMPAGHLGAHILWCGALGT